VDANPAPFDRALNLTVTPTGAGFNIADDAPWTVVPADYLDPACTKPAGGQFGPYEAIFSNKTGPAPQTLRYTRTGAPGPRWVRGLQPASVNRYEPDPLRIAADTPSTPPPPGYGASRYRPGKDAKPR
jgi:hypothetical protein